MLGNFMNCSVALKAKPSYRGILQINSDQKYMVQKNKEMNDNEDQNHFGKTLVGCCQLRQRNFFYFIQGFGIKFTLKCVPS